jgi:hypothetical protein
MRTTAGEIANAIAWALVLVLTAVAILVADVLGFVGVFILGLFTWMICTHMELDDATPTFGTAVFRARMTSDTNRRKIDATAHNPRHAGPRVKRPRAGSCRYPRLVFVHGPGARHDDAGAVGESIIPWVGMNVRRNAVTPRWRNGRFGCRRYGFIDGAASH